MLTIILFNYYNASIFTGNIISEGSSKAIEYYFYI